MKFEITNGEYVGTAEWVGPGKVALEMDDAQQRGWFARYFEGEDAFLTGPVGDESMSAERRNESEAAFHRAAFGLAAYAYTVKAKGEARRQDAHRGR